MQVPHITTPIPTPKPDLLFQDIVDRSNARARKNQVIAVKFFLGVVGIGVTGYIGYINRERIKNITKSASDYFKKLGKDINTKHALIGAAFIVVVVIIVAVIRFSKTSKQVPFRYNRQDEDIKKDNSSGKPDTTITTSTPTASSHTVSTTTTPAPTPAISTHTKGNTTLPMTPVNSYVANTIHAPSSNDSRGSTDIEMSQLVHDLDHLIAANDDTMSTPTGSYTLSMTLESPNTTL